MSGLIHGSSPWTRDAVARLRDRHPETISELEARIPAGGHVTIGAAASPGPWNAYLVIDHRTVAEAREHVGIVAAVSAVLWGWTGLGHEEEDHA